MNEDLNADRSIFRLLEVLLAMLGFWLGDLALSAISVLIFLIISDERGKSKVHIETTTLKDRRMPKQLGREKYVACTDKACCNRPVIRIIKSNFSVLE